MSTSAFSPFFHFIACVKQASQIVTTPVFSVQNPTKTHFLVSVAIMGQLMFQLLCPLHFLFFHLIVKPNHDNL